MKPNNRGRDVSKLDVAHLQRLAEFRFQLRRFLHVSQAAAERLGLHNQQYQMLQCVGGMPEGILPTIANVASRMLLKHNSTVELVDRTIEQGLLRRLGDEADHRRILLRVTPQGERILATLAEFHTGELEQSGPDLVRALDAIVHAARGATKRTIGQARKNTNRRGATTGDRVKQRRKAASR
jgi:DNA-binding MarR family transcriptional regulator